MQTTVQKPTFIHLGSGKMEIQQDDNSWLNLGVANNIVLEVTKIIKEFVGANAKMPPKSQIKEAEVNFDAHEIDLNKIHLAPMRSIRFTNICTIYKAGKISIIDQVNMTASFKAFPDENKDRKVNLFEIDYK